MRIGERLTPSVVHFPREGEPLVGAAAVRMRVLAPADTIYSAKRFIGLRGDELREGDAQVAYELIRKRGQPVRIRAAAREISPEEVAALVLRKLKADAEAALGRAVTRAVITVPAYFNDAQRTATKRAGELAGFSVERIVNEPTAAALAYGLDKLKTRAKIAVFDLGGGTFDISILELNNGVFEVLSTNGNTHLGGDDIDAAIVDLLREKSAAPDDPRAISRLREAAIEAKHKLSTAEVAEIEVPFFQGAESFSYSLTRTELERISRPVIERTRGHCRRALGGRKARGRGTRRGYPRRWSHADAPGAEFRD